MPVYCRILCAFAVLSMGPLSIWAYSTPDWELYPDYLLRRVNHAPRSEAHLQNAAAAMCSRASLDSEALLDAFETVEGLARGKVVQALERVVFSGAILFGIPPPDWTYGPLQLRYSKFKDLAVSSSTTPFSRVASRDVAFALLKSELGSAKLLEGPISKDVVLLAAKIYNGRSGARQDTGAKTSALIYDTFLYEAFLEARFQRLVRCS